MKTILQNIKKSCDISESKGLALAYLLFKDLTINFTKNNSDLENKKFFISVIKEFSNLENDTCFIECAENELINYFKPLTEKFNVYINDIKIIHNESQQNCCISIDYLKVKK